MFKNSKGFSLAEVIVAAGLLGALSLVLINISKNQAVVQKRAEASFEINTISNLVTQTLLNSQACAASLGGVGQEVTENSVTSIKNRKGDSIYEINEIYGNRQVRITEMKLIDIPSPLGLFSELKLRITFEKLSKAISGNKFISKHFSLKIESDAAGDLIKCYSSTENAVTTAVEQSCISIGGTYDVATSNCNLSNYVANEASTNTAVSTKSLSDKLSDLKVEMSCSVGEIFQGFDSSGVKICVPLALTIKYSSCLIIDQPGWYSAAVCPINMVVTQVRCVSRYDSGCNRYEVKCCGLETTP